MPEISAGSRRAVVVASAAEPTEELEAFMRMRRRNEGWMAETKQGTFVKSGDFSDLGPNAFVDKPPVLTTLTEQDRPGIFTTYLLWDSAAHFGHGSSEVRVGKFTYHTDSPEEVPLEIARVYKARGEEFKICYMKHMEVRRGANTPAEYTRIC